MTTYPPNVLYGTVDSHRRLRRVPEGARVRYRFRARKFAVCYIRYDDRIEEWHLKAVGDKHCELFVMLGMNARADIVDVAEK